MMKFLRKMLLTPFISAAPRELFLSFFAKSSARRDSAWVFHKETCANPPAANGASSIRQPTVSNLYPTPQTVFSSHWSLAPESFSRRRLI